MATIEGQLLELSISPGEQTLGLMLVTEEGSDEDGRYIVRPERSYGGVKIDGNPAHLLSDLIEFVMASDKGCMVKLTNYDGNAATVVEFARIKTAGV